MKNRAIKTVSLLLVMSMLLSVSVFAADTAESVYTFEYDDRTIEIDAGDLTYEEAKEIADRIVYGETDSAVSTYISILCIFGHDTAITYAIETTHKEYADAPRCVRRTYRVEYCTRSSCSHSEATMTSIIRLSCCPE